MFEVPYQFVEIEWVDAMASAEWYELDHKFELPVCFSRGWLVNQTDTHYVLTSGLHKIEGELQGGPFDIVPKGMVRKLTVLTYGKSDTPQDGVHTEPAAESVHREPS